MRFRLGMVIGFGTGYYLGAKAGRQRYEQINRFVNRTRESDGFESATDKARAVVDLGVERARDVIEDLTDKAKADGTGGVVPDDEAIDITTPNGQTIPFRP